MIELGIILAFLVGCLKGVQSVYQRRNALGTDAYVTAFSSRLFGLPVLAAVLFYQGIPTLSSKFLLYAIPQSVLVALASVLIAKAYKESEASIVTPMFALSPILVVFTSFLMLGELPTLKGAMGILLITSGAYTLKINESRRLLDPLRNLWDERGVQVILVVLLIYAFTANIDKLGVKSSSAVMWPLTTYLLSSTLMFPLMVRKSENWSSKIRNDWRPLSLLGLLGGAAIILQMMAIKITLVSYVISIKRLSIPIAVVSSFFMLKEKESFTERIGGSILMVAGAILIIL